MVVHFFLCNKPVDINLVRMTRFWNNLHQVRFVRFVIYNRFVLFITKIKK